MCMQILVRPQVVFQTDSTFLPLTSQTGVEWTMVDAALVIPALLVTHMEVLGVVMVRLFGGGGAQCEVC